jgi:hypothetical protein
MNSRTDEHRRAQRRVMIGIGVVAVLAAAGFLFRRSAPPPTPAEPPEVALNGSVSCSGEAIQITNNDDANWMDARVEIDSKYARVVPEIPRRQTVTLPTTGFTDSSATRFDPASMKCHSADIQAFIRGGRGHLTAANLQ